MMIRFFLLLLCIIINLKLSAKDFIYNGIQYAILDDAENACVVSGCNDDISELNIPSNVENDNKSYEVIGINPYAFWGNTGIDSLRLPNSIKFIGDFAFNGISISRLEMPPSVERINVCAFAQCRLLEEIIFNEGIKKIEEHAFAECLSLKKIVLPSTLESLGNYSFGDCFYLSSVKFSSSNKNLIVDENSFRLCPITDMNIGRNINLTGDECFYLDELKSLYIGENVSEISFIDPSKTQLVQIVSNAMTPPTIGRFTQDQYANALVYLKKGAKSSYEADENWAFFSNLTELEYDIDEYEIYTSEPNVTLNVGDTYQPQFYMDPFVLSYTTSYILNTNVLQWMEDNSVYAVAPGETDVVCHLLLNGKTATCHVTVIQPATSIMLNKQSISLAKGETTKLLANVGPADVTDATVTWSSTNEAVATVDNEGTVTAVGGGSCEIVATTHNGLEAKCQVTVTEMPESIAFESPAADIKKGEEITLAVTFTPESATERALTWTSSDASVASVSDGVVKGLKAGTAVITATTVNGKSAECTVTVHQPAETIVLDVTKTELEIGETLQLTAAVGPEDTEDKTVTWSSSDEVIATVGGDGLVTAVEPGEAVITATTVNGLTAECEIAVNAILVKRIELNRTAVEAEEGEQFQLTATVYPENATDKTLSWSSSDETVATVDGSGMVTVKSTGSARITAASTDGSDVKAECELTAVAGIDAIFADGTLWSVYTPDGLLIKADCGLDDLRQLASGLYILRSGTATRKIHLNR